MKLNRFVVCPGFLIVLILVVIRPAAAQPEAAAWIGLSRLDPTDYGAPDNWVDLNTGQVLRIPPNATTDVFFDDRAGQAPRDALGSVVVGLRDDALAAQSVTVRSLPFRFVGAGTLRIGALPVATDTLFVQNEGRLILDEATFDVVDSVFVGGGITGPTGPASMVIDDGGTLRVGDTLRLWNTGGSFMQLAGGSVRADTIDTDGNFQQFQWLSGQLSFDDFFESVATLLGVRQPFEGGRHGAS